MPIFIWKEYKYYVVTNKSKVTEKSIRWSKAIIGNAHMTRSLWLVALESKAGRHVYNGESMHLSILLRSKIWCSLRIPIAPSLMALLPLKVQYLSVEQVWEIAAKMTEKGEHAMKGERSLLIMGWPHLFAIEASGSSFVIMWIHRLIFYNKNNNKTLFIP